MLWGSSSGSVVFRTISMVLVTYLTRPVHSDADQVFSAFATAREA